MKKASSRDILFEIQLQLTTVSTQLDALQKQFEAQPARCSANFRSSIRDTMLTWIVSGSAGLLAVIIAWDKVKVFVNGI
jgi:hypothetical protein